MTEFSSLIRPEFQTLYSNFSHFSAHLFPCPIKPENQATFSLFPVSIWYEERAGRGSKSARRATFDETRRNKEMTNTMRSIQGALAAGMLAAALLSSPQVSRAAAQASVAPAQQENPVASALEARLNKKQYKDVRVAVDNGIATLSGSVDLYEYKADAAKTALHTKGVTAVRNDIQVAGQNIPDSQLQAKLSERLTYDRVGYGNVFDAISVAVDNGVVTLGGHAHNYPNRDSALALVATTPGVKEMIDDIEVDPLSTMDEQTRFAVAHAVYGYASLNRYAIDPAMPIRISVQNGNVELYGVVDSQGDKDAAYLRANGVPGVFSVKNYLQVANQTTEHR
jgi:osmotically-inducible protein OsmY